MPFSLNINTKIKTLIYFSHKRSKYVINTVVFFNLVKLDITIFI